MTLSSTLQLRILGDYALDKKLPSPRATRDEDNNADVRHSLSSDDKWPVLKRDESFHSSTEHGTSGYIESSATGYHGGESGAVAAVSSGECVGSSSDWNVISSNSFDDTYLEGDYSNSGMALDSSSLHHLNDPMNRLGLDNGEHELPVFSMPYPGTSWFQGGKNGSAHGNSFSLPSVGGLVPHSQSSSSVTTESSVAFTTSSCTPTFPSSDISYSAAPAKLSGSVVPYPTDVPSPVQLDSFSPCIPYTMEPSELLFADMNNWSGAAEDAHSNQQYQPHHGQTIYNMSTHNTTPHGFLGIDGAGAHGNAMSTGLHDCTSSYQQRQHSLSVSAGPPIFRQASSHDESFSSDSRWMATESCHQYSTSSTASTTPTSSVTSFVNHHRDNDHGNMRPNAAESLLAANDGQAIKRMLRFSTLNQRASHNCHPSSRMLPKADNSGLVKSMTFPPASSGSSNQSAKVQLLTTLNDCYWKNGRKNLQCFPSCPEHHDFYSMKMNNRKHSSVGVCRGPVYCHAFTDASEFLPAASTQQMKHKHGAGVPCGGSSAREVYVLGRFERVPQQEETNLLEELNAPPKFPSAAVFEQFRYTCFQAVEMEERRVMLPETSHDLSAQAADASKVKLEGPANKRIIRSTWFFLPDVWKVQPMLKKKRKATRSAPAQTFPFCFRIFIYTRDVDGPGYSCIADTASSFFELYSTRTVDRVKRKYWSGETERPPSKQRGIKRVQSYDANPVLSISPLATFEHGPPNASKVAGEDGASSPDAQQDGIGSGKVPKITILRLELGTVMKDEAVAHLIQILQATPNAIEKDIATDMKKYFDQKYGQTWHCIVGKGFGCSIAYDTQYLLFFRADQQYVLLFKSTE